MPQTTRHDSALTSEDVLRWRQTGKLAALGILLSYVEAFVPIPLPGVKLGLANVAVLMALAQRDAAGAMCVAFIKVLASSLLFGSPVTFAYSACGTLLSLAGMIPLSRLRSMRLWMTSIVGAILHEIGQLVVASVLLGTDVVWYLAPPLLLAGCMTGLLCGLLALRFVEAMQDEGTSPIEESPPIAVADPQAPPTRVVVALAALVAYSIALLHTTSLPIAYTCLAIGLLACLFSPTTACDLWRGVRPLVPLLVCTVALQWATNPHGACHESLLALARLTGMACAGVALMQLVPVDGLTGTASWVVYPLTRLGMRTEGFLIAFDVAVNLVPTLIASVDVGPQHLRDLPQSVTRAFANL